MELNFQKRLFLSNGERILSFDSGVRLVLIYFSSFPPILNPKIFPYLPPFFTVSGVISLGEKKFFVIDIES